MYLFLLTVVSVASAQKIGDSSFFTTGDLRWIGSLPPDLVLDDEGSTVGQGAVLDQRIRLGGGYRNHGWRVGFEGDLLEGQALGGTWSLGPGDDRNRDTLGVVSGDSFSLREASLSKRIGWMRASAGVMTSDWGLGMLANSGARDPLFGRSDFGDRVIRASLTASPLEAPLYFTLAADRGIEDEIGAWADDQQVYQGIASVLYRAEDGPTAGVYAVYRDQLEADDIRRTQVGVMDVYASVPLALTDAGHGLTLSVEAAGFKGTTDRATTYNSPEQLAVLAGGVVAQAVASLPEERALLHLRGGWASGDGNPDDDQINDFAFDRDYDAGMVMFDEVGGALAAANYQDLTDPTYSGTPPDGVDALLTEGAVQKATYGQLVGEVRPKPWLGVKLGGMVAWQTAPISYAFETYRNGGVPTNQLGEATSGTYLGSELDWAVRLGGHDVDVASLATRPELLIQGGHLLASDALTGGVNQTLLMASGRVRW